MLLSSFLATSTGVDDDIVAMVMLGLRHRLKEQAFMDLGSSVSEAHLELTPPARRFDGLRWSKVDSPH